MAVNALPLLHKYVLSPHDDMELKLAKLKFRLCVREVTELLVNRSQEKGTIIVPENEAITDDVCLHNQALKSDDSGIGWDDSIMDNSMSPHHQKIARVSEGNSSVNNEIHPSETHFPVLSSLSSSSTDSESEDCESDHILPADAHITKTVNNMESGFFESFNFEPETIPAYPSSFLESRADECDEDREDVKSPLHPSEKSHVLHVSNLTTIHSTDKMVNSTSGHYEEDNKNTSQNTDKACTDVDEALRILTTHQELSKICARKEVVTFSCWNVADLVRAPQKSSSLWRNPVPDKDCLKGLQTDDPQARQLRNRSNILQVTHEKILNKDKKLANMLQKIIERDEEEQRIMKEFMKTIRNIPSARPLFVNPQPSFPNVDDTLNQVEQLPQPPPRKVSNKKMAVVEQPPTRKAGDEKMAVMEQPMPRKAGNEKMVVMEQPLHRKAGDKKMAVVDDVQLAESNQTKPRQRVEETSLKKKKKKQGNVVNNFVHSLQRRFSKRGRDRDVTSA